MVRTSDIGVTLTRCLVYSRGVSFQLTALLRVGERSKDGYGDD